MMSPQNEPFKRNGMHILMLLLIVLTASLLVSFVHQVMKSSRLEAKKHELATEVTELEAETRRLQDAVEYAESDSYVERVAREQLGYSREGDTVIFPQFRSPTPETQDKPSHTQVRSSPHARPNWQRWWEALFVER